MKTKTCKICEQEFEVLFRIQIEKSKRWIFACRTCVDKHKTLADYKYGGTWKGKRH